MLKGILTFHLQRPARRWDAPGLTLMSDYVIADCIIQGQGQRARAQTKKLVLGKARRSEVRVRDDLFTMGFVEYIARVAVVLLGMVYPGYQSFKAVKRADVPKQQAWLKYWLVLSVVSALGLVLEPLLAPRVPLYVLLKIALIAFLVLPVTSGYEKVYHRVLEPQLDRHEGAIDDAADKIYKAGEEQARNLGPTVNKYVQQAGEIATKTLNKKTS